MTLNSIAEYVRENFISKKDSNLEYIVHSGSRGDNGFRTLIFYSNSHPAVVGKVSRDASGSGIIKEYQALETLQKIINNQDLIDTIEIPLSFISLDGNLILFKEYKSGIPGNQYIYNNRPDTQRINKSIYFLRAITDWLIKFLNETKEYHISSKEEKTRSAYELMHGKNLPSYLKYWSEKDEFFLAPSHGDLVPSNILMKDLEVCGIIDFENFALKGFPLADLIGIMVSTGTTLYGSNKEMIDRTFFNLNPFSQEVCKCVLKFCEVFKINIEDFIRTMPIYSDRSISICTNWDMNDWLGFHTQLKSDLIKRQNELILRDYI